MRGAIWLKTFNPSTPLPSLFPALSLTTTGSIEERILKCAHRRGAEIQNLVIAGAFDRSALAIRPQRGTAPHTARHATHSS
jgi:hypothetical protein